MDDEKEQLKPGFGQGKGKREENEGPEIKISVAFKRFSAFTRILISRMPVQLSIEGLDLNVGTSVPPQPWISYPPRFEPGNFILRARPAPGTSFKTMNFFRRIDRRENGAVIKFYAESDNGFEALNFGIGFIADPVHTPDVARRADWFIIS